MLQTFDETPWLGHDGILIIKSVITYFVEFFRRWRITSRWRRSSVQCNSDTEKSHFCFWTAVRLPNCTIVYIWHATRVTSPSWKRFWRPEKWMSTAITQKVKRHFILQQHTVMHTVLQWSCNTMQKQMYKLQECCKHHFIMRLFGVT